MEGTEHNSEGTVKVTCIENDIEVISLDGDEQLPAHHVDDTAKISTLKDELKSSRDNRSHSIRSSTTKNASKENIPTGNKMILSPDGKDKALKGMRNRADLSDEQPCQLVRRLTRRNPFVRFFMMWSSTVSDAVGVPGLKYVVNTQDDIVRRYSIISSILVCFQQ